MKRPSLALIRKAVRVHIAPSGNAYVTPGVAAMQPNEVYQMIHDKVVKEESHDVSNS